MKNEKEKICVYTLIDVYTRWCYVKAVNKINELKTDLVVQKGFGYNISDSGDLTLTGGDGQVIGLVKGD